MVYMKLLKKIMKSEEKHHIALGIVFVIYALFDIQLPYVLANMVDSVSGNVVVALLALSVFFYTNPILGILALVVGWLLVKRSSTEIISHAVKHYLPSENAKNGAFEKYNEYPETLEQEMVAKMAPLVDSESSSQLDYKPVLDQDHNAAPIDYEGVI